MTMNSENLAQMRTSYERAALNESQVKHEPIEQFRAWLDEAVAAQVMEANAMTLATVGPSGAPSTRVVLLKGMDERGLVWYTNYESRKGQELAAHPQAALQFFWPELERVVRIEGLVERISQEESDAYYRTRPLDSRIGAWASPQSQVIASRDALEASWSEVQHKQGQDPIRPPHWGGFRLQPQYWEFWQGRPSRLHDRLVYVRQAGAWVIERLAP